MPDNFNVRTWVKTLPSRAHPERNEDAYWSATNGMAHAVIDGMGSSRRIVNGREVGGEHAAAGLVSALKNRLEDLPSTIAAPAARELLTIAAAEAGEAIFKGVNAGGNIPPEQVPEGKTAHDIMAAACMTALIFCEAGRRAVIGQNGDTRAYLYSNGDLILLTDDQDAIYLDLANGIITEEQAVALDEAIDNFPGFDISQLDPAARQYFARRNLVYGQIGDAPRPDPPVFTTIRLQPGDMIALVSDGVYSNLTTSEIQAAMSSIDPAATLVDRGDARSGERNLPDPNDLSAPYNYRAHQDDTTALVIKVEW
jgi:serine/threonine protein phosphatase PrpC